MLGTRQWITKTAGFAALLGATALAGPAFASVVGATSVNYATQAITTGTNITVPNAISDTFSSAAAIAPTVSSVTFTLPTGVTFAVTPTATCTFTPGGGGAGSCTGASITAGGINTNSVTVSFTYAFTTAAAGNTIVVQLNSGFSLTDAALATPTAAQNVTVSSGDVNFQPAPATAKFASSQSALTFVTGGSGAGPIAIDVGPSGLAKKFLQPSTSPTDVTLVDIGNLQVGTNPGTFAANGTTPFAFTTPANLVVSGNFANIAGAYLAPAGTVTCATPAPAGAVSATLTGSSATFANITVPAVAAAQEVCLSANGTGVIGANPNGFGSSATVGTSSVAVAAPGNLSTYTFNGVAQQLSFSGYLGTNAYTFSVRIVNNSATAVPVLAVVQGDNGVTSSTTLGSVPAASNEFLSADGIVDAAGVAGPVSMLILAPGAACVNNANGPACPVTVTGYLTNPNGEVVMMGSGDSP
jgi:hypothetical protein